MQTGFPQITRRGYKIIKQLGQGGFGTTYLVVEEVGSMSYQYALKHFTFPSHDPDSYATAQRLFQREAAILKTLNGHPQIPNFIDYWDENQEFYLLQEFISGDTLYNELNHDKKSEEYVVEFLTSILEILRFVHQSKIIHRDINPSNIIRRSSDNQLVLIDFGAGAIKKIVTTTTCTQVQSPPTKIYTRGYAPIEQIQGKPQYNSDIYALGVTAIEMLTGIEPQNLMEDHNGEIIWRKEAVVSDRLADILNQMVRADYRDRYSSVEEVLVELQTKPLYQSQTQLLTAPSNLDSFQGELARNQIYVIILTFISLLAIMYAAGVLPATKDIKPENQPSISRMGSRG